MSLVLFSLKRKQRERVIVESTVKMCYRRRRCSRHDEEHEGRRRTSETSDSHSVWQERERERNHSLFQKGAAEAALCSSSDRSRVIVLPERRGAAAELQQIIGFGFLRSVTERLSGDWRGEVVCSSRSSFPLMSLSSHEDLSTTCRCYCYHYDYNEPSSVSRMRQTWSKFARIENRFMQNSECLLLSGTDSPSSIIALSSSFYLVITHSISPTFPARSLRGSRFIRKVHVAFDASIPRSI
ncbi:hypothetical protein F2P81_018183 [Scophthalmus maximus]|uniref:Uncharacterized protein n=1 Tax=Scophthalmus maximus TaxID=52904 RepID=A0A6A4S9Z3_SCOMX|nr:hypothetical protein F2P81_018183 [Scophthalmus maximus]